MPGCAASITADGREERLTLHRPLPSARAAQFLEIRGLLGDLGAAAETAELDLVGALIVGDLNCSAGGAEHSRFLQCLPAPTVDLLGDDPALTFPLGAWRRRRYELKEPNARLDYILHHTFATEAHGLLAARAYVARDAARVTDKEKAVWDTGVVSDHAPMIACLTL